MAYDRTEEQIRWEFEDNLGTIFRISHNTYEPRHDKRVFGSFQPGQTQTSLRSHRS